MDKPPKIWLSIIGKNFIWQEPHRQREVVGFFFPIMWHSTGCCMILKNRDSFKGHKPEHCSLAGCHLFESILSAFLKDMPQSHRSYWSHFWGEGTKFCCLLIMEDRCGSSNDPVWHKTLWNSKGRNKSHQIPWIRGRMFLRGRKAFFHSYRCHNKLGNRIMCTCVFCLVTKQASLLTVCFLWDIEHWKMDKLTTAIHFLCKWNAV